MRIARMLFVSAPLADTLVFMADKGKSEDMTTVGSLVKQAMTDQQLTTREVDRLTEQAGHRIAYSAISRIRSGRQTPTTDQLNVLSKVLKVPLEKLRAAMGMSDRFTLPEYADRLSTKEREAIRNLIQAMVESKDDRNPKNHDSHNDEGTFESPASGYLARSSPGRFEVIDIHAESDAIAARNRRDGDPDIDDDNLMGDA